MGYKSKVRTSCAYLSFCVCVCAHAFVCACVCTYIYICVYSFVICDHVGCFPEKKFDVNGFSCHVVLYCISFGDV